MEDTTILLKKVPADLKQWLAEEAGKNDRSMNREAIRLLEEARATREAAAGRKGLDERAIDKVLAKFRALPVLDGRTHGEMLYDADGLPK